MSKKDHNESLNAMSRGCGIDELRYRRAYALAKYELAKMRMVETVESVKGGIPSIGRKGIWGKILGSLDYIDYAVIAYRIGSKLMKWRRAGNN